MAIDMGFTDQIQRWLSEQAQRRAMGGGAVPPTVAPVGVAPSVAAPTSAGGASSIFSRPISAWGALKTAGRGALSTLRSHPVGAAAAVLPAAGALASKMAGGSAVEGALRPDLLTNALGEGYARFAPTWMGGISKESIAAGDIEGASDIEGRFGARSVTPGVVARPRPAVVGPTYNNAGPWTSGYDLHGGGDTIPGSASYLPPVAPFTAEDIRGSRVPVRGTGAFMNSRGEVTNLDTRASAPVAEAPEANYGVAGNMIGAMMNQRRAAATEARGVATNKMLMDYALKAPGAQESANKAAIHAATLEQAKRAADAGASPSDVSLILAGRAPVSPTFGVVDTIMPDKTGAVPVLQRSGPGAGTIRTVTPQPAARTATAADLAADVKRLGSKEVVLREYARRNITPPKE